MGKLWLVVCLVVASSEARADVAINLKAKDPVAGLPAISADGTRFLRSFKVWKKGCKKPEIQAEYGQIDASDLEPQYSSVPLIGGCGEAVDAYEGNVSAVNESLRDTQCASAVVKGKTKQAIPASLDVEGVKVAITTTKHTVQILINPLARTAGTWTGGRRVELPGATEIHGWYVVDQGDDRQLALLFAAPDADGNVTERWIEVWMHQVPAKPTAVDQARTWLLAVALGDAATLAEVSGATFERGGLGAPECKEKAAKKKEQVAAVLTCAVGVAARYAELYDEVEFETIKVKALPKSLKPYKKKITKLAKKGSVVQFHVEQDGWNATVVFVVKAGKVIGAFEALKAL